MAPPAGCQPVNQPALPLAHGDTWADRGATMGGPVPPGWGERPLPYRYRLWRRVGYGHQRVTFIMLNPSTATADEDDPTIRRCQGYARRWGFDMLEVVNLFAWRATDPTDLDLAARSGYDVVGRNLDLETVGTCGLVIAAWGAWTGRTVDAHARARRVRLDLLRRGVEPLALRLTKDGHPGHPLYLPADIDLEDLVPLG